MNNINSLTQAVKSFLFELFNKDADVIAVIPTDRGWHVTAEILMDEEYTIKRGRNDLLYVFDVITDSNQNILSYARVRIRERGKMDEEREV